MNELVKFMFSNWVNWVLVLITLFILTLMITSALRILIETALPKAFDAMCLRYFVVKNAKQRENC